MIGLLQAEGLVSIFLAPLHELATVEALVIPVKDSVGLDQSDGFVCFHDWPPGFVLFLSRLVSGGDGRGLNIHAISTVENVKKSVKQASGRIAASGARTRLVTLC